MAAFVCGVMCACEPSPGVLCLDLSRVAAVSQDAKTFSLRDPSVSLAVAPSQAGLGGARIGFRLPSPLAPSAFGLRSRALRV